MLKIWIYLRKSTDSEDSQMLSLEKQKNACSDLLRNIWEYEIIKTWEESVSAKKAGKRPGFSDMLKMIKKWDIDCIVSWKISRLSRNSLDWAQLETLIDEKKLKKIVTQDGVFDYKTPSVQFSVLFGMSKDYSKNLWHDASEGMLTKVKGWQPVKLPKWYEFDKLKNAQPNKDAPAIKEIFRLRRLWLTLADIAKSVKTSHGFDIAKTSVDQVLKNPLYYGMIKYMWELYKWLYEPIVRYDEWKEANDTNRSTRRETKKDELDFCRNLISSKDTWNTLSPYLKDWLIYFSSVERWEGIKTLNISLGKIIIYFDSVIHNYSIPLEIRPYYIEWIREYYDNENGRISDQKDTLDREVNSLDKRIDKLLEMRLNEEISWDEYKKMKNEAMEKKEGLLSELKKLSEKNSLILEQAEETFELLVNLYQTWNNQNIIGKVWIIKMITSELFLDHEKALHLAERELFEEVRNLSNPEWLSIQDKSRDSYRLQNFYRCLFSWDYS